MDGSSLTHTDAKPKVGDPSLEGDSPALKALLNELEQAMVNGTLDPDGIFPSADELAQYFSPDRLTISQALKRMGEQGYGAQWRTNTNVPLEAFEPVTETEARFEIIEQFIAISQQFPRGSRLPSRASLIDRLAVTSSAVKEALSYLRKIGIIINYPKGTKDTLFTAHGGSTPAALEFYKSRNATIKLPKSEGDSPLKRAVRAVERDLHEGFLDPDGVFPSTQELAQRYGVDHVTMHLALKRTGRKGYGAQWRSDIDIPLDIFQPASTEIEVVAQLRALQEKFPRGSRLPLAKELLPRLGCAPSALERAYAALRASGDLKSLVDASRTGVFTARGAPTPKAVALKHSITELEIKNQLNDTLAKIGIAAFDVVSQHTGIEFRQYPEFNFLTKDDYRKEAKRHGLRVATDQSDKPQNLIFYAATWGKEKERQLAWMIDTLITNAIAAQTTPESYYQWLALYEAGREAMGESIDLYAYSHALNLRARHYNQWPVELEDLTSRNTFDLSNITPEEARVRLAVLHYVAKGVPTHLAEKIFANTHGETSPLRKAINNLRPNSPYRPHRQGALFVDRIEKMAGMAGINKMYATYANLPRTTEELANPYHYLTRLTDQPHEPVSMSYRRPVRLTLPPRRA